MSEYTTAAEDAATIRKRIKSELGYGPKLVSVRCSNYSMGSSVKVTIRAGGLDCAKIRSIALLAEHIDRCPYSGDILSGGNRYVECGLDWQLVDALADKLKPEIENALDVLEPGVGFILQDSRYPGTGAEVWACTSSGKPRVAPWPNDPNGLTSREVYDAGGAAQLAAHLILDSSKEVIE
jgi:hypothetical protein